MSSTTQKTRTVQPADATGEHGTGDSPTQLVNQILKRQDSADGAAGGEQDIAATVAVMLRVQPPSSAMLMIENTKARERLELALKSAGFEVTTAPAKDQAIEAMLGRHYILAVTDRLEIAKSLRALGTSRLLQIVHITSRRKGNVEAALRAGADECVDGDAPEILLQARFAAARRMGDLESALRATFVVGRKLATTDELTGVANRRFFAKHYAREISRAARHGHAVAVAMCDIDHFKRINDEHGHGAGDQVLRECAQRMQRCLRRGSDWMARLGGDEFVVVMPETDIERALDVCRKLRDVVSAEAVVSDDGVEMKLTASLGLAAINSAPKEVKRLAERLLAAADQALYHRKKAGRNGVTAEKLKWEPTEAPTSPGSD
jgi:two-component system cell cycle response regulator